MSKQMTTGWVLVCGVVLLFGLARASTNRYAEKQRAIVAECAAEQKRLGVTDRKILFGKYPTPEITLCKMVRVLPGRAVDVVLRGKFAPGTKFLFENDSVEVMKETMAPAEYRATVQVPPNSGPSYALLHAFAPVSGGNAQCQALYVGGRYEWEFAAPNGWRVRLVLLDEGFQPGATQPPEIRYRAEFFRGAEPKPFETRNLRLSLTSVPWDDAYSGSIEESGAPEGSAMAEMEKLTTKMQDPKLSDQERERLIAQFEALSERIAKEQDALVKKMSSPTYAQDMEKKEREFGCRYLQFRIKAGAIDGSMTCGQNVGTLQLKGTMKFLGP